MTQEAIWKLFQHMLGASAMTGKLFAFTLLIGLPLGLILALGRMSKVWIISFPIRLYLLIMRGTPLILQLFFFCYGPYYIIGVRMDRTLAAILGMGLNYAAYFAEIYRAGIQSIPKGQYEAATVLGFTKGQTFRKIVLPQVIKRILPPMGNEFMTLVKDTALVNCIGVAEIYLFAKDNMSSQNSVIPLIMAGVFYLVMNSVVARIMSMIEKRLDYYR